MSNDTAGAGGAAGAAGTAGMTARGDDGGGVDWAALRAAARAVMANAYVPYSKYKVGAAALTGDGRIIAGCNVENASYGLTLCAECSVVSQLHSSGGGTLVALACVDGDGAPLTPCGRCRQLLFEHGGAGMLIDADGGPVTVGELLPGAFGPAHLVEAARARGDAGGAS